MSLAKKLKYILPIVFLLPLSSLINVVANDAPEFEPYEVETAIRSSNHDKFVELSRNENFIYEYKEDSDVIRVLDAKTNEELWKTGQDVSSENQNKQAETCLAKLEEDPNYECAPYEKRIIMTNSLVTAYYYQKKDDAFNLPYKVSSADSRGKTYAKSTLMKVKGETNHYRFDFELGSRTIDATIMIHIYFDKNGVEFEVRKGEIIGEEVNRLIEFTIAPLMGTMGGEVNKFNKEAGTFDKESVSKTSVEGYHLDDYYINEFDDKYYADGYIVIPDGSGSIIPFKDNTVALGEYSSYVYGQDYANNKNHIINDTTNVPLKDATMPMYGVVHNASESNSQKAFVAFATKGEQHMSINVHPDKVENDEYVYVFNKFRTNFSYSEYYDGTKSAPTLRKNIYNYNMGIRFDFLKDDDASYVGIAKHYRDYLINQEKQLTLKNNDAKHITTRLDFIMSDAEDSVLGVANAVVTTAKDVKKILNDTIDNGVENIVTSLHGWQDGGITLGSPDDVDFTSSIGTAGDFKSLVSSMRKKNIDVSVAQDYFNINENQIGFYGNAVKHVNGKYVEFTSYNYNFITEFGYAKSNKSLEWVKEQNAELRDDIGIKSMTVSGISNRVISHNKGTRETAMNNIDKAFSYLDKKGLVNADQPNKYLWKYVDRYFNIPVNDSQHLIEEQEIPLLQLVLSGCMEMYAPYSNFSFYDKESILKMIDYNVYPSFILSELSSHYLSFTNSAHYYSTEYSLYKDLIKDIYTSVDSALKEVINAEWINRKVLAKGVIVNEYSNGKKIVVNYSDSDYVYEGVTVTAEKGFGVI